MPVHDWTRVSDGTFHDFHTAWIVEIRNSLNDGLLPSDHYAMAEQVAGDTVPDVLTLRVGDTNGTPMNDPSRNLTAVAVAPPKVRFTTQMGSDPYVARQRTVVIRHSSNDKIVALLEIVSPGNKSSRGTMADFVEKCTAALAHGFHLLLIDLHPPTPRDPQGIHGVILAKYSDEAYVAPADKPLTLAAYVSEPARRLRLGYVEPIAAGDTIPDMPLFLDPDYYVPVPLEATYQRAYRGVPQRWKAELE